MQMLKKWIKLSLLWLGLIALVLFHYVTGITPLILKADTFNYYENYSEYVVTDFDDYTTILNENTPNIDYYIKSLGQFYYETTYCPYDNSVARVRLITQILVNGVSVVSYLTDLDDIDCLMPYDTYFWDATIGLNEIPNFPNDILTFDDVPIEVFSAITITPYSTMYGYNISITDLMFRNWFEYDFNNTYLMSTFLLDTRLYYTEFSNSGTDYAFRPFVLYAETLNDRYNVYNNELSNVLGRKKYAVEIPNIDAALVVNKIGTGFELVTLEPYTNTFSNSTIVLNYSFIVYGFNAAPMKTPFDDVALDTTPNYSVCDNVLGFPIDCTLDGNPIGSFQAMANDLWEWTIKESPIFSDVWTLASGGFQWLSNTFQFLGYFDTDSLLGGILALLLGVLVMLWAWVGG